MLMRLESENWWSGVEYVILAITVNVRRVLSVSQVFRLAWQPMLSVELMPLNTVRDFLM